MMAAAGLGNGMRRWDKAQQSPYFTLHNGTASRQVCHHEHPLHPMTICARCRGCRRFTTQTAVVDSPGTH
jgi:hypothetical protein